MPKRTQSARIGLWLLGPVAALVLTPGFALAEVVIHVPGDQPTLQAAVSAVPNGGTIELTAGTYASPVGGFLLSNLNKGFTVRASGGSVYLDGGSARPVLRIENTSLGTGKPIVFESLTFRNGSSPNSSVAGGVTLRNTYATFADCVFVNNQRLETTGAEIAGGGVGVSTGARAFFTRSVFNNNRSKNNGGGLSISNGGVAFVHETQFLANHTDVPAHRNTASGGAISVVNGRLFVTNSRFEGNRAGYVGGAIMALGSWVDPVGTPTARVVIVNSAFIDNKSIANGVTVPGPTEAGAVHAEDQATVDIYHSRFELNAAQSGGAVNTYRGIVNVDQSVFIGNRAFDSGGGGFGGTFNVISNDTSSADPNRRSGSLSLRRSYVQGIDPPAVTSAGRSGGCLHAAGDFNRRQGAVTPQGTAASTRATVVIEDVVFFDCDVTGTTPAGGGFNVFLADFHLSEALVGGSESTGSQASGGGGRVTTESIGSISNTTFARNIASNYGGGLWLQGSDIDVTGSRFVKNEISPGTSEAIGVSFGAGLFTAGQANWPTTGVIQSQFGAVSGSTFSENIGLAAFDDDRNGAGQWLNDQRYNGNTFFGTTFGSDIYSDSLDCCKSASELNGLVVVRAQGNTDKSQVANSQPGVAPIVKDIRIVPTVILSNVPVGDTAPTTLAYAGYGWSGDSATLDGGSVSGFAGSAQVDLGMHTLSVSGQDAWDDVSAGAEPDAELLASPAFITSGNSSDLDWQVQSGDLLAIAVDQGIGELGAASGTVSVTPPATTTYRTFLVTEQGGKVLETTVFVDEPNAIFIDGFGSGDATAWTTTVP